MRLPIALFCLAALAGPSMSRAQTIYATGFEAPAFNDGNLAGQDGWLSTDNPPIPDHALVQTAFAFSGVRAVEFDAAASFASSWFYRVLNYVPNAEATPLVQIKWSMFIEDVGAGRSALWGIDLYDDTPLFARRITAAGVNAENRAVIWNGNQMLVTSVTVAPNAWHTFRLILNVTPGSRTVRLIVDEEVAAYAVMATPTATATLHDVSLYKVDGGGDDRAFFDDFSVMAVTDLDADGIPDIDDACPATGSGESVDFEGCSTVDSDGDGVGNDHDTCTGTPSCVESVDATGCPDVDSDGDMAPDGCDNCPGLSNPDQLDTDGDGLGDACDVCPILAFGDVNGDQAFNGNDIQRFGEIILEGAATQEELCAADFNEDSVIDLDDIPLLVDLLIAN